MKRLQLTGERVVYRRRFMKCYCLIQNLKLDKTSTSEVVIGSMLK